MTYLLREHIGKTCHVYMDDISIFSENITQHFTDLEITLEILKNANMKISLEILKIFNNIEKCFQQK